MKTVLQCWPLALLLATSGCATPGASALVCRAAVAQARQAAEAVQPLPTNAPAACLDAVEKAWSAVLRGSCEPLFAFHTARRSMPPPTGCDDAKVAEAAELGRMIAEMETELEQIRAELARGRVSAARRARLVQRRITIERDLPQLEALARFENWLPPANVSPAR